MIVKSCCKFLFLVLNFNYIESVKYEELVEIHHIDVEYVNEEYMRNLNISLERVSAARNADKAVSFEVEVVKIPENFKIHANLNQFLNNAYKTGYVDFKGNVCDIMKHPFVVQLIMVKFQKLGYIPPNCPIKPDKYWIKNFVIDQKIVGAAAYKDMTKGLFKIEFIGNKIDIAKIHVYLNKIKKRIK